MKKVVLGLGLFLFMILPYFALAEEAQFIRDEQQILLSQVKSVIKEEEKLIPGTDKSGTYQTIEAEILEGDLEGRVVIIEDDYLNLEIGEKFYLMHTVEWDTGREYFSIQDKYRLPYLFLMVFIFVFAVLFFGGIQGMRGILSLLGSLFLIIFVLLPGILNGFSPIFLTIAVSSVIIILGSYITHGFNKTTSAAVIGMIITVFITGFLAYLAVDLTSLTGYESEEAIYLSFNSRGSIDIVGLLFGGIMIGLLGALYDASIGQAIAVEELRSIAPHVGSKKIYERAMRMGREHIGALVDTLAIAYVGTSLPLLLLFYQSSSENYLITINREIFATEIVRTMVGSIGLILAVPVTTIISVKMFGGHKHKKLAKTDIEKEEKALEEISGHSHKH